ncbi:MAG: GDP-fucose synthetase [Planctomycetes bacterium]|nr:GDP-fucose synthetase [Planctomycetota bacterium]
MSTFSAARDAKVFVAGHRGMVGSAIVRTLEKRGYSNLLLRTRDELDLSNQASVQAFFETEKPDYVFLAAAKVGGILANDTYPAEFIYENLGIQTNVIHSAHLAGVQKLLFLGSTCIYPKMAPQPLKEEYLLTGPLEPTNEWYAVAKIAGIKLCQAYRRQYGCDFISAMPTNLYGPGDDFDPETSHVAPGIMRKMHTATIEGKTEVELWGTGRPRREFLHVDDLAEACCFLMDNYSAESPINVGTGKDLSIRELAETLQEITEFSGDLAFDETMPDGTPRKLVDTTRINQLGWKARIPLREGLEQTYRWYVERCTNAVSAK